MKGIPAKDLSVESLLGRVADEYSRRLENGEQPDVEEYAERHPQIAAVIRQVFPALQVMGPPATESSAGDGSDVSGRLGDFNILREIGRGGMGIVYEASQISLNRRVALKVLPFAAVLDSKQVQRFKNEAQAAAQLHHTNIVPVYSVGCERGVHYYAMQYIEGLTLSAVISELRQQSNGKDVGLPDRADSGADITNTLTSGRWAPPKHEPAVARPSGKLARSSALGSVSPAGSTTSPGFFRSIAHLGVQAADALHHAHEAGILHRDIKPSNLLLDAAGKLWITDFGLAQIRSDPGMTMTGDLLGTMRYMSPEQALAKRVLIDERTDVYSLGVTLYEMFTLQPAVLGSSRQEVLRQIAFEEPRDPRRVNPAIPTELDTIVLKAIAKNPIERYLTARELAEDLRRFLDDQPIKAKPPSLIDKATKWSRRHKPIVASALFLLLMAVIALSISTALIWQAQTQTQAALQKSEVNRKRADANFEKARDAVDQMLTRVGQEHLAYVPQVEDVRRELLEDALQFYREFLEESATDPQVRRETARAYYRVGSIQQTLGRHGRAEESFRQAHILHGDLVAEFPAIPEYRMDLARTDEALGRLLWLVGSLRQAADTYDRVLKGYQDLVTEAPNVPAYRYALGRCLVNFGEILQRNYPARLKDAEDALRRGITLVEELVEESPAEATYRMQLARGRSRLADMLQRTDRSDEAEETLQAALELQEALVDEFPQDPGHRKQLAISYNFSIRLLRRGGRTEEAKQFYRKATTLLTQLVTDYPKVPEYREHLAWSHEELADARHLQQAEDAYREAGTMYAELVARFPTVLIYREGLARGYVGLGQTLRRRGEIAGAEEALRKAIGIAERAAADFPQTYAFQATLGWSHVNLGWVLFDAGRLQDAEPVFEKGLSTWESLLRERPNQPEALWGAGVILNGLGTVCMDTGRLQRAEKMLRRGASLWDKLYALPYRVNALVHGEALLCLTNLGRVLQRTGRVEEADGIFDRARTALDKQLADLPDNPRLYNMLADILSQAPDPRLRDADRAVELAEEATKMAPGNGLYLSTLVSCHVQLGETLRRRGDLAAAEEALRKGIGIAERAAADFPQSYALQATLGWSHNSLGWVLFDAGRLLDAESVFENGLPTWESLLLERPNQLEPLSGVASILSGLGRIRLETGRLEDAKESLRRAASLWAKMYTLPEHVPSWAHGNALGCLTDWALLLQQTGRGEEADGVFDRARKVLDKQLAELSENPHAYNMVAWIMAHAPDSRLRDADRAVELAEEATKMAPGNGLYLSTLVSCHVQLGETLRRRGDLAAAEEALRKGIGIAERAAADFPQSYALQATLGWSHNSLGWVLFDAGRLLDAESVFENGLPTWESLLLERPNQLEPLSGVASILSGLGRIRLEPGRLEDAEESLRRAASLWAKMYTLPEHVPSWVHGNALGCLTDWGVLLQQTGRGEEADGVFDRARKVLDKQLAELPENPHAYNMVAWIMGTAHDPRLRDVHRAVELAEEATRMAPANDHYSNTLGVLYYRSGKWEQGISTLKDSIEHSAGADAWPEVYNNLAWFLATAPDPKLRDADQAVELAESATKMAPGNGNYLNTLGVAYYRNGNWEQAISTLQDSIEHRGGGDSFDFFFLAMAYWQLGDEVHAQQWYAKADAWMEKNRPQDDELGRFRAESEALLGIADPATGNERPPGDD